VTHHLNRARPLAGMLALSLGLTLVAPPAFAAEAPTAPAVPAPALAAAAAAKVEAMPAAAVTQAAQATPAPMSPATSGKPFFKSTKGVVVLVLMATAVTWAAVSRSQNAVHSPGRQ